MYAGRERSELDARSLSIGAFALIAFILIAITRWPLAPKYLYYFDSVNFALALDEFNPTLHQPQPPGYPLFVGLTRLLHWWIPQPERVLLVAGMLAACAALMLIWLLATEMFGRAAGFLAAALLFANPPFWLGGITNQVRLFLAVGSLAVALAAWRATQRSDGAGCLYGAFAALGVASGFRPAMAVQLLPLLIWVWWRTGRSVRRLAIGGALLCAAILPWLLVTAAAAGGLDKLVATLRDYSAHQFRGSSALFGSRLGNALHMATQAVVWNGLGTLSWIWAIAFAPLRAGRGSAFLAVWFLPPFLFSAVVHIGDPDQALASIPVLCVIGGGVLARMLEQRGRRRVAGMAATVAAANALLFFVPPGRLARASSYPAVRNLDRRIRTAIDTLKELRGNRPAAIVHYGAIVTWRQIAYYFPDDCVVVLPADPAEPVINLRHRKPVERGASCIPAGSGNIFLLAPRDNREAFRASGAWRLHGPVLWHNPASGSALPIGSYRLEAIPNL
jgi:hypothetical protein